MSQETKGWTVKKFWESVSGEQDGCGGGVMGAVSSCGKRLEFLRLMQDSACTDGKKVAAFEDFYQISSFVGATSSLV